ncbi:hypothetical protein ID866_4908 [Astraeus odoratus]|nr:hypothetical protein ID866_4908 [Astraeus odoratus]
MLFGHKSDSKALAGSMHRRLIEGGWEKLNPGQLSSPQSVLRTLHALGDNSTAETYASSGGTCGVIHSRVGANAADGCGLGDWAKWFTRAAEANQPSAKGPYSAEPVQSPGANTPTEMLKILLQVYAEDGDMQQASRLLNSQVGKLDVTDIISIVPMTWPLCSVSSFLIRSLRHSLHTRHEGQIVKAISAGQNLEALDRSYVTLREEGAIIEEAVEGDDSGETEESFDEKSGLVEKVAMQLGQGDVRVVNVEPHS